MLPKGMYKNVHSSFIYQSPKPKLLMSTESRMEKLSMANVANRKVLGNKKRTHNNMDESETQWYKKKRDTERVHTLWFHLHEIQKWAKLTYIQKSE